MSMENVFIGQKYGDRKIKPKNNYPSPYGKQCLQISRTISHLSGLMSNSYEFVFMCVYFFVVVHDLNLRLV